MLDIKNLRDPRNHHIQLFDPADAPYVIISKHEEQLADEFARRLRDVGRIAEYRTSRKGVNAAAQYRYAVLAEIGVATLMREVGYPDNLNPDFTIHKQRKFSSDLPYTKYDDSFVDITVKSTDRVWGKGISWVVQADIDRAYDHHILNSDCGEKNYIACTFVDGDCVALLALLPVWFLHENNLFTNPHLEHFIGKKLVFYHKDLIEAYNAIKIPRG